MDTQAAHHQFLSYVLRNINALDTWFTGKQRRGRTQLMPMWAAKPAQKSWWQQRTCGQEPPA